MAIPHTSTPSTKRSSSWSPSIKNLLGSFVSRPVQMLQGHCPNDLVKNEWKYGNFKQNASFLMIENCYAQKVGISSSSLPNVNFYGIGFFDLKQIRVILAPRFRRINVSNCCMFTSKETKMRLPKIQSAFEKCYNYKYLPSALVVITKLFSVNQCRYHTSHVLGRDFPFEVIGSKMWILHFEHFDILLDHVHSNVLYLL